jgi:hypothetical protein
MKRKANRVKLALYRQRRNRAAAERRQKEAVAQHRRYCMSCGTHLVQAASKQVGLCQACRRHCVCCGRETGTYGYYDVCTRCKAVIDETIEYMKRHKEKPLPEKDAEDDAPRRENCVSCGDPAEMVFEGRPYCAECFAEKEDGCEGSDACADSGVSSRGDEWKPS